MSAGALTPGELVEHGLRMIARGVRGCGTDAVHAYALSAIAERGIADMVRDSKSRLSIPHARRS
ncbi:hypothetical protein [Sphingomonas oligoaromativorans]|uniref:hypothetical protein n=1 Tax=Sphingomonas oligoaromativorans TaxID=575322 RepID=UPI00141E21E0|nr:hypothetical protein [Sphingomonas oligoaromativorans]NIJ34316.1 hypothetical protein [Sphingomonas oligoaromativorans]